MKINSKLHVNPRITATTAWAETLPRKIGKAEFLRHLNGERLTARQRLNAACFRCSSGYDTGIGCKVTDCPLCPLNPYNLKQKKADLSPYDAPTDLSDDNGHSDD